MKRYALVPNGDWLEETPDGEFVRFEDHEAAFNDPDISVEAALNMAHEVTRDRDALRAQVATLAEALKWAHQHASLIYGHDDAMVKALRAALAKAGLE